MLCTIIYLAKIECIIDMPHPCFGYSTNLYCILYHTCARISQLPTCHSCIPNTPSLATHCAPYSIIAHFYSTFQWISTASKPNITFSTSWIITEGIYYFVADYIWILTYSWIAPSFSCSIVSATPWKSSSVAVQQPGFISNTVNIVPDVGSNICGTWRVLGTWKWTVKSVYAFTVSSPSVITHILINFDELQLQTQNFIMYQHHHILNISISFS